MLTRHRRYLLLALPLAVAACNSDRGPKMNDVDKNGVSLDRGKSECKIQAKAQAQGLAKGETLQGKRIVIVEDVTTTGGSALKAAEAVREAGGEIVLVLTMVDREEGATEAFAEVGLEFRSLYKAGEFLKV